MLLTISSSHTPAAPDDSLPTLTEFTDDIAMDIAVAAVTVSATPAIASEPTRDTVMILQEQVHEERRHHQLQRANAEQARRVAECLHAIHAVLLRQLSQACFTLDENYLVSYCNPAFCALFSQTEQTALGRPVSAFLPGSAAPDLAFAVSALLRGSDGTNSGDPPVLAVEGPFKTPNGVTIQRLKLIPQYRIPGILESILVLLDA